MKLFLALFAVAALTLAAASTSFAQKGYGGYGYTQGYPQGYGGYGQYQGGYGGYGGYGYGPQGCGNCAPYGQYGGLHGLRNYNNFGNVPQLPPPAYTAGPPSPTVTYPYYTTRGPRDFLLANPPSIGP